MKTARLAGFFLLLAVATDNLHGQINATPQPQDTPYAVVARDAHSSTWEKTTYELSPSGQWIPQPRRYVETATGLNFWDANTGQWQPSGEQIVATAAGAAALTGQHQVTFASDLSASDSINITMPDGQLLKTRLLGLSYYDSASGQSVLIAEITNCTGQIIAPNQVWYDNAFSGVKAGVRYTYTRAGFEQDIVLEQSPAAPEAYGLNSASTILQALTEIISAPVPTITTNYVLAAPGFQMEDQTLLFGKMKIGKGLAFLMVNGLGAVRVTKEWLNLEGRQFLVEEVPMPEIAGQLQTLPASQTASIKPAHGSMLNVVSEKRLLPPRPLAQTPTKPMRVASVPTKKPAFVIDFQTLNISQTNMVFQGDTTYYISGNVNLYGTNSIFEGGSVLKYASGVTLRVNTPVAWQTAPYRPVVLLAKDQNGTGEPISGSTGNPGSNYYAATALYFDGSSALTNLSIDNLRIANASVGVALNGQSGHSLNDVQLVNCGNGIAATNTDFGLHNALFWNVVTNFTGNSATGRVEQLTSDTAAWLNQNITNLFLTNCLLTAVTNVGICMTDHVASVPGNSGVFQTGNPGGFHYLATISPYRGIGTTNISPSMLTKLPEKTTYPPLVFSNQTFTTITNFGPKALRDTGLPDYGYLYDPIDYVFGGCTANSNMSFTAGTAVGWFRTSSGGFHAGHGIHIGNQQLVSFNGTATAPDYWVRCNAVQEQDNTGGSGPGGITSWASQSGPYTNAATVSGQFLKSIAVGSWGENSYRDDSGFLIARFNNCEFYSTGTGAYVSTYFFTNCLLYRTPAGVWQGSSGNQMVFQNCTIWGSYIYLEPTTTLGLVVKDTSLDGGAVVMTANLGNNSSYATYNHNAYTNATNPFPLGGTGDHASQNFNWQTSWLGNFYLPTNSILIDAGDVTADAVGLYHFTTQTNQTIEGTSLVDTGYHYVATDTNGVPIDTNGDGISDYLEDSNGDGLFDAGDLADWLISPYNGLSRTSGLTVFTPLK